MDQADEDQRVWTQPYVADPCRPTKKCHIARAELYDQSNMLLYMMRAHA